MADTLKFELVSPERMLASSEAEAVTIPGQLGEFTAMPKHAPFLTTLRPGYVTVTGGAAERFFVTGGFAEIADDTVSILAEEAVPAAEMTADWIASRIETARATVAEAGDEQRRQIEAQRLADLEFHAGA